MNYELIHTNNETTKRSCKCKQCGNTIYHREIALDTDTDTLTNVWECANCGEITPRQARTSAKQKELNDIWETL